MANNTLKATLEDLKNLNFLLTRFNPKSVKHDDLDILIHSKDFKKSIFTLEHLGYKQSSHDHALGGRIAGMQVNLIKPGRIKIDLHQDFTWRRNHYLDLDKLWKISHNKSPNPTWDGFLTMINIIFEKTYFMSDEYEMFQTQWQQIKNSEEFRQQADKYGWNKTFQAFRSWTDNQLSDKEFPLFLPIRLVLLSYLEKFDFISLIYYLFFRIRFVINRRLPYEII